MFSTKVFKSVYKEINKIIKLKINNKLLNLYLLIKTLNYFVNIIKDNKLKLFLEFYCVQTFVIYLNKLFILNKVR